MAEEATRTNTGSSSAVSATRVAGERGPCDVEVLREVCRGRLFMFERRLGAVFFCVQRPCRMKPGRAAHSGEVPLMEQNSGDLGKIHEVEVEKAPPPFPTAFASAWRKGWAPKRPARPQRKVCEGAYEFRARNGGEAMISRAQLYSECMNEESVRRASRYFACPVNGSRPEYCGGRG